MLVFTIRLVHYARVIPREKFWKDPKNLCIIVIIVVGGASVRLRGWSHQCGTAPCPLPLAALCRAGSEAGNCMKTNTFWVCAKGPDSPRDKPL